MARMLQKKHAFTLAEVFWVTHGIKARQPALLHAQAQPEQLRVL